MKPDFSKTSDQLIPAIVQDASTLKVLMLGYMNAEAFETTQKLQKVTFYSRSKKRLWTKGEESGNFLHLKSIHLDCDRDTLLIYAQPEGPICHKGTDTCWGEENTNPFSFLTDLEQIIEQRKATDATDSYVASLFRKGINKIKNEAEVQSPKIPTRMDLHTLPIILIFHFLIYFQ